MKKILLLILPLMTMVGCDKNVASVIVDQNVGIYVVNTKGENMLSLDTEGHLDTDLFKLYYVNERGNKVLFYNSMLTASRGFSLFREGGSPEIIDVKSNDKTFVCIYTEGIRDTDNPTEKMCVNYFEWSPKDIDTIECKFYNPNQSFHCISEVKVNGELLWSTANGNEWGTATFKKVIDGDKSTITLVTDEILW